LPPAGTITFIDSYFVVNKVDSGQFNISAQNDGLVWAALDFATAESSPDNLVRVINAVGQLWLFGERTTEIWTNTGDSVFPFERISGAKMETGCAARDTVLAVDTSVFWVGRTEQGTGVVYRAKGFTPLRISTHAIEEKLQEAGTSDLRAWSYQQDGHLFYAITGGALETTLVYDLATELWHERAYLNESGQLEQHLASCCMFAFGKHLVGDRRNGNIYEMSQEFFSDNGEEISSQRIFTHLSDEDKRIRYNKLTVVLESGIGTATGQGVNPIMNMALSKDAAKTWSDEFPADMGRTGQYWVKAQWRRLGIAEVLTFRISITDPVKRALIGAYLE
jgi:hypothetical protein